MTGCGEQGRKWLRFAWHSACLHFLIAPAPRSETGGKKTFLLCCTFFLICSLKWCFLAQSCRPWSGPELNLWRVWFMPQGWPFLINIFKQFRRSSVSVENCLYIVHWTNIIFYFPVLHILDVTRVLGLNLSHTMIDFSIFGFNAHFTILKANFLHEIYPRVLITLKTLLGKRNHLTKYHSSVVYETVAKVIVKNCHVCRL